jgi:N-acylneuraminate cytidylyltransferase
MKKCVIIPARKNSKRLKNKNILPLGKMTLIEHSIVFALKCDFDKIFVTSDDEVVEDICKKYKNIIFHKRNTNLAQDDTSTLDVMKDVIKKYNLKDYAVTLFQPTSPFRDEKYLEKMFKLFEEYKDTIVTVNIIKNPRYGFIENNIYYPSNYRVGNRTQDLKEHFHENGNTYIFDPETILKNRLYNSKLIPCIIDDYCGIDIDHKEDLEYAEFLLKKRSNEQNY